LGAKAIHEALNGRYYNELSSCPVYFLETIDATDMLEVEKLITNILKAGKKILVNVVTKSGTTLETVANFQVVLSLLKIYFPKTYSEYVVVTTDKDSILWNMAEQEQFDRLEIPTLLGGRYSVFSAVGLFPLLFIGIDIDQLLEGAQSMFTRCLEPVETNPAALSALLLFMHYQSERVIHDTFLFSVELENVGKWYRQLMGESIGKEHNVQGKKVEVGITPTVSVGSIDLHSVAQLYLGGPRERFTTFITIEHFSNDVIVPDLPVFKNSFSWIQNRSFSTLIKAISSGTQKAYQKNNRPFCSILLPEKDEYSLGQLLQMKMLEIVYLAHLLEINPFDQPHVELYKKETHQILKEIV